MSGAATGLFGKLPAHGDFVRRGAPVAAAAMLDRWIEREARSTADLAALDGARIAFVADRRPTIATALASEDAVGRGFPVFALLSADVAIDPDDAERWCAAAAALLVEARDDRHDADTAHAALSALVPPAAAATDAGVARWWRCGTPATVGADGLPTGDAFAAMLAAPA